MIDIKSEQLELLLTILKENLSDNSEVYAFGSRTNGTARKYSDLDLVINIQRPLEIKEKITLKEAFSESDLNFRVDISDWFAISDPFKESIKNKLKRII